MKAIFLFFIVFFFSIAIVKAQMGSINGIVIDSVSKKSLEYATIGLKNSTGQVIKSTLSKDDGTFAFEKLTLGKYSVNIISVGYKTTILPVEITSQAVLNLGRIDLQGQVSQLQEVVITADKSLIKQEVDRIAYDVQADPESKVQNGLDMLRKVPLITVDAEDNIKLKGNVNYKILVNGRPSSMMSRDPKEV